MQSHECDDIVFNYIKLHGPKGMVTLENNPPPGLTSTEARVSAQRLVSRGFLTIDKDLKIALMSNENR